MSSFRKVSSHLEKCHAITSHTWIPPAISKSKHWVHVHTNTQSVGEGQLWNDHQVCFRTSASQHHTNPRNKIKNPSLHKTSTALGWGRNNWLPVWVKELAIANLIHYYVFVIRSNWKQSNISAKERLDYTFKRAHNVSGSFTLKASPLKQFQV